MPAKSAWLAELPGIRYQARRTFLIERQALLERLWDLENSSTLPEGVTLSPGELRVELSGVEDLLQKLYQFGQPAASDIPAFAEMVEGSYNVKTLLPRYAK